MEQQEELTDGFFRRRNVDNLLLMAVLGSGSVREKAQAELRCRKAVTCSDAFEDLFMTNLSVV